MLFHYKNRIQFIDALIRQKSTGPPKELARKLGVSERWLYIILDELKTELGGPIRYDRRKQSYVYDMPGKIVIGFTKDLDSHEKKTNGGYIRKNIEHCIYKFSIGLLITVTL